MQSKPRNSARKIVPKSAQADRGTPGCRAFVRLSEFCFERSQPEGGGRTASRAILSNDGATRPHTSRVPHGETMSGCLKVCCFVIARYSMLRNALMLRDFREPSGSRKLSRSARAGSRRPSFETPPTAAPQDEGACGAGSCSWIQVTSMRFDTPR